MMDRARACVDSTLGTRADASPALLEALGTLMQGCDAQGEARMAQGVQQLCSAAGLQLIDAQGKKLGAELRYRFCILRLEMLVSMASVVLLSIIACNFGLGMYQEHMATQRLACSSPLSGVSFLQLKVSAVPVLLGTRLL